MGWEVQSFAGADHAVVEMLLLRSLHTMESTVMDCNGEGVGSWSAVRCYSTGVYTVD